MRPDPFPIRRRHLPGHEALAIPFHALTAPEDGRPHLLIDPVGVARGPLVRGRGPAWVLDPEGQPPRRIVEQARQREGVLRTVGTGDTHLARARAHDLRPRWLTGCGNLGFNPGVLAGRAGETARHGAEGPYGAVWHVAADGAVRVSEELPDAVPTGFWLTGPALVRDGRPGPSAASTFADPRHLLGFPYLEVAPGQRVDFGHDRLLGDPTLYERAVAGEPVVLRLLESLPEDDRADAELVPHEVEPGPLEAALAVKGYRPGPAEDGPGHYELRDGHLRLAFLPGLYPHHALALDAEGRLHDLVIGGASNRAGVALVELAEDLVAAGFREALLLDNGGDVGLFDATADRFLLAPAEADRADAWPLTAALAWA